MSSTPTPPPISDILLVDIRRRFAQIDHCSSHIPRIFFENAGGALTLLSVVETSKHYAAIADNQGRSNATSQNLNRLISKAKTDLSLFMNAPTGQFFVGESGTELIFRLVMNTCLATPQSGVVLGSTIEHPATRSACKRWADLTGKTHHLIPHNSETGRVTPEDYAAHITPDTHVATILHTSPVTGMGIDIAAIAKVIRTTAPDCFIIIDGIQHAAHGCIDIERYDCDGYVISPYKMFSRHGYGLAWISDRLAKLPHDSLLGGPAENWELGTRDTGAYATLCDVIEYMAWLGAQLRPTKNMRDKFIAAGEAIIAHEKNLTDALIYGPQMYADMYAQSNLKGLTDIDGLTIIGGADNPAREGLVSFYIDGIDSAAIVAHLNAHGIRTHIRKADHYSSNILTPLGRDDCVRISLCHYNSMTEVAQCLAVINALTSEGDQL